ncbi:hypothetical protein Tco_0285291 [Tanacetum coccineum]
MFTYLKNMEGKKLKDLKNKYFDYIRWMFDSGFQEESTKKQKVDEDKDTAELQSLMEVIPDEEEVAIDVVPLAIKSPSIVGWKIHKEGKKSYYQIMRADGKSQMYRIFSHMLKSFSREDLEDLYKLVKAKYESTRPVEDLDLLLWGDLKTMFEPHVEDTVWRNQQDYKVLEWKLYDSCGVHSLRMQHVYIYMLVEKRYPLTPSIITDMLNKKLQYKVNVAEGVNAASEEVSTAKYLKGQPKLGLWYPKDSPFDLVAYTDSDYAGASLDRKSTTGGCQFLGCRLISWQCKKQTVVANSITEAEYLYLILLGKAKKSVKLMMEKLFRMELELMLFWSTVKAKTINGKVQLHSLVDGKKLIITESNVRRDLQLEDAEGVDCLPNSTIFEQLTLMGSKTTAWNEFSSTMASAIICLATNQKFNFSKYIFESMIRNLDNLSGKFLMYPSNNVIEEAVHKELGNSLVRAATTASSLEAEQDSGNITKTRSKATPNESSSLGTTSGGGPKCQETMVDTIAQTRFENVSKHSNDSLLARGNTLRSDKDRLKLN